MKKNAEVQFQEVTPACKRQPPACFRGAAGRCAWCTMGVLIGAVYGKEEGWSGHKGSGNVCQDLASDASHANAPASPTRLTLGTPAQAPEPLQPYLFPAGQTAHSPVVCTSG